MNFVNQSFKLQISVAAIDAGCIISSKHGQNGETNEVFLLNFAISARKKIVGLPLTIPLLKIKDEVIAFLIGNMYLDTGGQ
mgnify:CR=1 FL=1